MNKENKSRGTVKVSAELLDLLKDEQYARRKQTGVEPTYEELLLEWRANSQKSVAENSNGGYTKSVPPPSDDPDHAMLDRIKASTIPAIRQAISANLRSFCSARRTGGINIGDERCS